MTKKLLPEDDPKGLELQIKKHIEEAEKLKGGEPSRAGAATAARGKTLKQKLKPDTPLKMAVWAGIVASIAGIAAYAILKKRD